MGFEWEGSSRRSRKKGELAQRSRLLTLKRFCLGPMRRMARGSRVGVGGPSSTVGRGGSAERWKLLNLWIGTMVAVSVGVVVDVEG